MILALATYDSQSAEPENGAGLVARDRVITESSVARLAGLKPQGSFIASSHRRRPINMTF